MSETLTIKGRFQTLLAPLAQMVSLNPVLLSGESWTEQDAETGYSTGRRKVGNGLTAFNALPFEPNLVSHLAEADPHPQYNVPANPVFTYNQVGQLIGVAYSDGSADMIGWDGDQVSTVDFTRNGVTLRSAFTFVNNYLQSIVQGVM